MCVKVGILGCGMIGCSFIKQANMHPGFEVVSLYSRSNASLNKAAQLIPTAKRYNRKKEFFADIEIEAVIVCTPHAHHTPDALLALQAGKHILIEKPIATHQDELSKLLDESSKRPNIVITALPHGNNTFISIARDLINLDAIGKVTALHSYLDVPGPPRSNWYYSKSAVGGASLDTLPYALARVLSLLQVNVINVCGLKSQLITHRLCEDGEELKPEVDDNASLLFLFSTGQHATVRTTWNIAKAEDFLIIQGREGEIRIDAWRNTVYLESCKEVNYPGMQAIADNTKKIQLDSEQPEYLKLTLFEDHIKKKSGNFKEVSYFMKIIFSQLFDKDINSLQLKYYNENQTMENLQIGADYI